MLSVVLHDKASRKGIEGRVLVKATQLPALGGRCQGCPGTVFGVLGASRCLWSAF